MMKKGMTLIKWGDAEQVEELEEAYQSCRPIKPKSKRKQRPRKGVPIASCLGDQHAAMLGQKCRINEAKSTYVGTKTCSYSLTLTRNRRSSSFCLRNCGVLRDPTVLPKLIATMKASGTSFSVIRKKTPFQKHREEEEAKKKRADEDAARLYEEFVESFKADDGPGAKAFVRGGTINPDGRDDDSHSKDRGIAIERPKAEGAGSKEGSSGSKKPGSRELIDHAETWELEHNSGNFLSKREEEAS
ncbi:hypothetical protein L7F22_019955 [Adiantum nelumboides]|nr:hypothetical protein [Adiantum nelumboides]